MVPSLAQAWAYEKLGLTPLDTFIKERLLANKSMGYRPTERAQYAGIGASTWMCVRCTLGLIERYDTLLIAPSQDDAEIFVLKITKFLTRLSNPPVTTRGTGHGNQLTAQKGGTLRWMIAGDPPIDHNSALVFEDTWWKARTIRRAKGPFAMITEVRLIDGVYEAYAEEDEHIMDLPRESALALVQSNQARPCGFSVRATMIEDTTERVQISDPVSRTPVRRKRLRR